jgi:hypothetical protein
MLWRAHERALADFLRLDLLPFMALEITVTCTSSQGTTSDGRPTIARPVASNVRLYTNHCIFLWYDLYPPVV